MADLDQLIADVEAHEPSRELADRVLLACSSNLTYAIRKLENRPDPLRSIDDAVLMVPEGCIWAVYSSGYAELNVPQGEGKLWKLITAKILQEPAKALTLAALRAVKEQREPPVHEETEG